MTPQEEKTFETLQKPTMSLIAEFYDVPKDVSDFFADMMAVYEANPAEENAKAIWDKVSSRDKAADKKAWLAEKVSTVAPAVRAAARKKYLEEKAPVPKGVPMSGQLLTFLDVVPRAEKDILMDAQAAARILKALDNPYRSYGLQDREDFFAVKGGVRYKEAEPYAYLGKDKKEYYQAKDGSFENAFLDKPFATPVQRLAHVTDVLIDMQNAWAKSEADQMANWSEPDRQPLYQADVADAYLKRGMSEKVVFSKIRNQAVVALTDAAQKMNQVNPLVGEKLLNLAQSYTQTSDGLLMVQDYEQMKADYKDTPIADVLAHRTAQITGKEAEKEKKPAARMTYRLSEKEEKMSQLTFTITSNLMKGKGGR